MRIAMFQGYDDASLGLVRMRDRTRALSEFGDTLGDFITSRVNALVSLNDQLYSSLASWKIGAAVGASVPFVTVPFVPSLSEAAVMDEAVNVWHEAAKAWMDAADAASNDPEFFSQWKLTGGMIAANGKGLAKDLNDNGLAGRFAAFESYIGSGLSSALWAIGKPLFIVGGILLGVLVLTRRR